jgi:non-specific protein-tyrosine kinase
VPRGRAAGKDEPRSLVDASSPYAEPFRTLRLALGLRNPGQQTRAVLVTSPNLQEGKSTVAANLAWVASAAQRVLLIDCDLRQPVQHARFRLQRSPGLVDLFADGDAPLSDYVQGVRGLDVLTSGRPMLSAADLLSSARMEELINAALETYNLVVMDSPPILAVADGLGLAAKRHVDVVLVVSPTTRRRAIRQTVRELELVDANIAGVVANRFGRLPTAYGYGYTAGAA